MRYRDCKLPDNFFRDFERAGYKTPSVIQAQAWPNIVKGSDVVRMMMDGEEGGVLLLM